MQKYLFIFFLSLLPLLGWSYEERNILERVATPAEVKASLLMDQKWVPYPAYKDREGWNQLLGDHRTAIIHQGERYLGYQWEVVKASQYMEYEKSGSRAVMQDPNNRNTTAFSSLLMAELAEGQGRFMKDIVDGVFFFCEMTSWAESAHLAAYQKTHRALPDYRENILELHQGSKSQMLAWTYYFLHKEFDKAAPGISQRLRYELQRRELDPYLQRDDFWWMATKANGKTIVNNWNPWCNSNALLCFMLLENNRDTLDMAVEKSMRSVDKYLNYVKSDGACEEGPTYWMHATGKVYDYLEALSLITNGKISLFQHPMIRQMGEYIANSYIGDGWVVNFADASSRSEASPLLIYRCGQLSDDNHMRGVAVAINKQFPAKLTTNWMDFFPALENLKMEKLIRNDHSLFKLPRFVWYPQTEVCFMRNSHYFLGAKGGYNDESHNHNDIGSCVFYKDDIPFLIDVGVGTYTRQTFSADRYKIWTMQSDYHNLPVINGFSQRYGRTYKAEGAVTSEKKSFFRLDLHDAYPKEAGIEKWIRTYQLASTGLVVTDQFKISKASKANIEHFMTWGAVDDSREGEVKITVKGKSTTLYYDPEHFTVDVEKIALDDPRLAKVWGDCVYRISLIGKNITEEGSYSFKIK